MDIKHWYFGFSLAQVGIAMFLVRASCRPFALLPLGLAVFSFICYLGELEKGGVRE